MYVGNKDGKKTWKCGKRNEAELKQKAEKNDPEPGKPDGKKEK